VVDVTSDWGAGLTANIVVTNNGATASSNWMIELDTTEQITNIWNATILSHVGSVYMIANESYNGAIGVGGSTLFGFQANHMVAGEGLIAKLTQLG